MEYSLEDMNKLIDLCEQVVEATPRVNEEVNECYCPFCSSIGYYSDEISNILHEKDCAYLIAKKLLEENKQNEIRITYLPNPY